MTEVYVPPSRCCAQIHVWFCIARGQGKEKRYYRPKAQKFPEGVTTMPTIDGWTKDKSWAAFSPDPQRMMEWARTLGDDVYIDIQIWKVRIPKNEKPRGRILREG